MKSPGTGQDGSGDGSVWKVPVYRFWSQVLECHFYTVSEEEEDNLIKNYPHIWTFEGVA
jgi:hypothetical protein